MKLNELLNEAPLAPEPGDEKFPGQRNTTSPALTRADIADELA